MSDKPMFLYNEYILKKKGNKVEEISGKTRKKKRVHPFFTKIAQISISWIYNEGKCFLKETIIIKYTYVENQFKFQKHIVHTSVHTHMVLCLLEV